VTYVQYVYVLGRGERGERRCREEERGDKCTYDVTNMHRVFKGEGGVSKDSFVPKKQLNIHLEEGENSDQVRA
jgi:hypothetical protein